MTTSSRNTQIAALYESGLTCRQVAERFGVSHQRIQQILSDQGVEARHNRTDIASAQYADAVRQFRRGVTIKAAAEAIGVHHSVLRRRLIEDGFHTAVNTWTAWTPYELRFLQNHYCRTLSASRIAKALGRTRNEVIGKAHRMNLSRSSVAEAA